MSRHHPRIRTASLEKIRPGLEIAAARCIRALPYRRYAKISTPWTKLVYEEGGSRITGRASASATSIAGHLGRLSHSCIIPQSCSRSTFHPKTSHCIIIIYILLFHPYPLYSSQLLVLYTPTSLYPHPTFPPTSVCNAASPSPSRPRPNPSHPNNTPRQLQ